MFRHKHLDRCLEEAETIKLDKHSKYIFFSDVHRGDNSMSDEFAHNQDIYYHALERYFEEGYTYIEVGDGDELWEHGRYEHLRQAHSDVYLLIKKFFDAGRFYYMYGNHNMVLKNKAFVKKNLYVFDDEYTEQVRPLFPGIKIYEALKLECEETKKRFLVVHGHQGDFMNDRGWRVSMFSLRYFWRFMHMIGFKNPASPSKNRTKRHKIEKNYSKWIRNNGVGIICGHTHRPKLPLPYETPYLNTGCCIHPRGITGIELVGGKVSLVDWRVRPFKDGRLFISKVVMRGPISLDEYGMLRSFAK